MPSIIDSSASELPPLLGFCRAVISGDDGGGGDFCHQLNSEQQNSLLTLRDVQK